MANKLNAENLLINNVHREGYETMLNTDVGRDLKFCAKFLRLIVDYRDKIGYRGQLLIQTHEKAQLNYNNKKEEYFSNFFSIVAFLKQYNLDRYYKLSVQPGHDFNMANVLVHSALFLTKKKYITIIFRYNCFGAIDILEEPHQGKYVLLLKSIIEIGGVNTGGMTIYLPNHNDPFEAKDLLENYVVVLDCLGKALRIAVRLVNDVQINKAVQVFNFRKQKYFKKTLPFCLQFKYTSFSTGWGAKLFNSDVKLEECEEHVAKMEENKFADNSQRNEHWNCVLNRFLEAPLI